MIDVERLIEMCRVPAGTKVRLDDYDPAWSGDKGRDRKDRKRVATELLSQDVAELAQAQELLYASDNWALLIVLQAMDAAGKDGIIKHVMSGVNPAGCQVCSFKQPSAEELDHHFLWRYGKAVPERGRIGIFNRSYYEEVLVVKVHPELLEAEKLPRRKTTKTLWKERYQDINAFERHLTANGVVIVKFFLHLSKEEQRRRLLARLDDANKHWKFSPADIAERAFWDDYMRAYETALSETSSEWAPWYVVPADHKWVSRALVAAVLTQTIAGLNLAYPEVTSAKRTLIEEARTRLEEDK
jgi:PPK2 family polyphosphate:nucleotide phosphotransferase